LANVSQSLDNANRERFLQKLTAFRLIVRSFLTLLVKFVDFSMFGSP
jgi:hypothetical protein